MNTGSFTPAMLLISVLTGACSSIPANTPLLAQTQTDYLAAQQDRNTRRLAPLEMTRADAAMASANKAAEQHESELDIDRLAHIARQTIALARETSRRKADEAVIADAGNQRDILRLEHRTAEADNANSRSEQARQATLRAQNDTARAELDAESAKGQANRARRDADQARVDTVSATNDKQMAEKRNAQLETQLSELSAKKTARGMVITLNDLLFATDSAGLSATGLRTTQKLAAVLAQNPERSVLIEGHTDNTGSNAHNQTLSESRAGAVARALIEQGVTRDRMHIQGYGESNPMVANDTAQNRQLNRRVEIILPEAGVNATSR